MIARMVLLIIQKYIWSKLLRGSFKSKIMTLFSVAIIGVFGGALFASLFLDMSYKQGMSWAWGYAESSASLVRRLF